jgi:hypothetical protein
MRDTSILSKKVSKKEGSIEGRSRATPIPPDFKFDIEWAMKKNNWTFEEATQSFDRCRDHYLANGKPFIDWQAVGRKWVTSPFQQKGNGNGNGNGHAPRPHSREARIERTSAAWEQLIHASEQGDLLDPATPLGLPKPQGHT